MMLMNRWWMMGSRVLSLSMVLVLGLGVLGLKEVYADPNSSDALSHRPKLMVVKVYADWCSKCRRIDGTYRALEKQTFQGQVQYVVLDVSNRKKAKASEARAQALGIGKWFKEYRAITSIVAVISVQDKQVRGMVFNETNLDKYVTVIQKALAKEQD